MYRYARLYSYKSIPLLTYSYDNIPRKSHCSITGGAMFLEKGPWATREGFTGYLVPIGTILVTPDDPRQCKSSIYILSEECYVQTKCEIL